MKILFALLISVTSANAVELPLHLICHDSLGVAAFIGKNSSGVQVSAVAHEWEKLDTSAAMTAEEIKEKKLSFHFVRLTNFQKLENSNDSNVFTCQMVITDDSVQEQAAPYNPSTGLRVEDSEPLTHDMICQGLN